jgi:ABC-type transport system substrate-binding protein
MKFHDGSAVTAEDLKWSLEKAAQPASGRTYALLTLMDRVEVVDPRTVRVIMKSPDNTGRRARHETQRDGAL